MKILIADTAPLILLAKLTLLDVLCRRFNVVIPLEVASEATRRQELADAKYIQKLVEDKNIHLKKVDPHQSAFLKNEWGLGRGESEVLALAMREQAMVVTDDFAAMRATKAMGLRFTTTPRLLIGLQRENYISLELARAKLSELEKHAWISPGIINHMKKVLEGGK